MTEHFAPTVLIDGQTYTPEGCMWILAYALAGCQWAIDEVNKPDFGKLVDGHRKREHLRCLKCREADLVAELAHIRKLIEEEESSHAEA